MRLAFDSRPVTDPRGVGRYSRCLLRALGETADPDAALIRHLRVLEKWRSYETVDDIDFVRALDQPDLFGDEQGS